MKEALWKKTQGSKIKDSGEAYKINKIKLLAGRLRRKLKINICYIKRNPIHWKSKETRIADMVTEIDSQKRLLNSKNGDKNNLR